MSICHIALGSNLSDRQAALLTALERIGSLPTTRVRRVSRFIETAAVGGPAEQPSFLNAAAELETRLSPIALWDDLRGIELALGRTRHERWGPRVIDLDLLLWGSERIQTAELTIPHPHMHYRRFVLEPLVEIAPEARHPAGWTVSERWQALNRLPHYLAITGPLGVGKTTLARQLAERLGAELVEEEFDSVRLGRMYSGDRAEAVTTQRAFLASRSAQLDRGRWVARPRGWVVSDFWFRQSLAYAEVLLEPDALCDHRAELERAAIDVLEPTLVVWLDATPEELAARIATRGRSFEGRLDDRFLTELRAAYARILTGPTAPPLYRPDATSVEQLTTELETVAAAIAG